MAKQKRVLCYSHGALAAGPHYQTHWEDVWLKWSGKPGQRIYRAAPMIATRADLEAELWINRESQRKRPEHDYGDEIRSDEALLAELDRGPYARNDWDCPSVYTNAAAIDRAEAERMLAWFMESAHGVRNPKFVWIKPEVYVQGVSFAGIEKRMESATAADAVDPHVRTSSD
jgi:hypothetical protein